MQRANTRGRRLDQPATRCRPRHPTQHENGHEHANTRFEHDTHGLLLDVNLDKLDVGELVLELGEVGADELARAAPGGPVVDNDDVAGVDLV